MTDEHAAPTTVAATFLFTDLEGSTAAWEANREAMADAMRVHDVTVAALVAEHRGDLFKHMGDGVIAAFQRTDDAVDCAVALQHALVAMPVRTRMGVHVGEVEARDGDYFGPQMNRAARVMGIAHGGQILLSAAAHADMESLGSQHQFRFLGDHRLKGLFQAESIYQLVVDGLETEFPPVTSLNATIGNLPSARDLIGREQTLGQLDELLWSDATVVVIGPGGVGKTSVAVAAARAREHEMPDGTWWVDLTNTRPGDVTRVVVEVLGLNAGPDVEATEALELGLSTRKLRVVLDNCEAVVRDVAELIGLVAERAPHTRIVATSRVRIDSARARHYQLQPLEIAGPASPAVDLFIHRSAEARPGGVAEADRPVIERICQAVDGLPLAIELAASRVKVLSPEEILNRLDQRFSLLRQGRDETRTLLATLEWSFDLLEPQDQELFTRLGVFRSPFDLAGARHVASDGVDEFDVLETLANLADNSMLITSDVDGETVYRRLESVREFAALKLADAPFAADVRERHANEVEAFGRAIFAEMLTDQCRAAADRAVRRMPDVRAAVDHLLETDPARVLRLLEDLSMAFTLNAQIKEAGEWIQAAIERLHALDASPAVLARAYGRGAELAWQTGDHGRSTWCANESLRISEQAGHEPDSLALIRRATVNVFQGDSAAAIVDAELVVAQVFDDPTLDGFVLGAAGVLIALSGERDRGVELVQRSLVTARGQGPYRVVIALLNLNLAVPYGQVEARIALSREGLDAARLLRSSVHEMIATRSLALALIDARDPMAAETVFDAIVLAESTGQKSAVITLAEQLAFEIRRALPREAVKLLAACSGPRAEFDVPSNPVENESLDFIQNELRLRLGADAYDDSVAIGRSVPLEQLVGLCAQALERWLVARVAA